MTCGRKANGNLGGKNRTNKGYICDFAKGKGNIPRGRELFMNTCGELQKTVGF